MQLLSRRTWRPLALLASLAMAGPGTPARSDDPTTEAGFVPLFNGQDLTGWRLGDEVLDGKTVSADHRFSVRDGHLACHGGPPENKEVVTTARACPRDFVLRLEFRAGPRANSGLFLRGQQ